MLRRHFKNALYIIVFAGFSFASAGSLEEFFIAVRNDNTGNLERLLERGFDPNSRDEKGRTGLAVAVQERSPKAAKLLLAQPGIEINALNAAGESALMMAAIKGDAETATLLLDRGAQVNQPGWSPLHYAATGPEPRLVQLLLGRGAVVDALSPNETTPLMMAAQYGSEDSAVLLLAKGADPARRNQQGLRALDFAKRSGREPLVARLQKVTP
jgi:uncharacterized protein